MAGYGHVWGHKRAYRVRGRERERERERDPGTEASCRIYNKNVDLIGDVEEGYMCFAIVREMERCLAKPGQKGGEVFSLAWAERWKGV